MAGIRPHDITLPGHASPGVGFEAPFEMLGACHERVLRMLELLARLREHVKTHGADTQARDAARDVMRYFDQAGPQHHEDEERHVFPPLLAQHNPTMSAVLAVVTVVERLQQDHREMAVLWALVRSALNTLHEAAEAWAGFSAQDQQRFDTYDALYRRHLLDEDQVVYPAARRLMQAQALQAMSADMMTRRGLTG